MKLCRVKGCGGKYYGKGLCKKHYAAQPKQKAKKREYAQRPEVKAKKRAFMRAYFQRPEVKAKQREYFQRPEVKAKQREYAQRPEVKAKKREYAQRPEVKAKRRAYMRTHYVPSWLPNIKSTDKALDNARKFLPEETAKAFVFDGVLLEKRLKAFGKPKNLDSRGMIV